MLFSLWETIRHSSFYSCAIMVCKIYAVEHIGFACIYQCIMVGYEREDFVKMTLHLYFGVCE